MKKLLILLFISAFASHVIAQQSGCISGDCKDGYGTYVWPQDTKWAGDKYIGYWKEGSMHGKGTYYFNTGAKYAGNWDMGHFSGEGTYTYSDGEQYVGQWKGSLKHGYGTYYFNDGKIWEGEWKDDKFIGETKKTGCISGNCANGYGTYVWESGEKYEGYWKDDKRNGQGTNYYADGAVYKGNWLNDKQHGRGNVTYANGDKYTGDFSYHKREGQGTYTFDNGNKYVGEWKAGKYHGYGTLYKNDGTVKSGNWEYDEFIGGGNNYGNQTGCVSGNCSNGYGIYKWDNGDKYEGYWENDKLNGEGTYTFNSGEMYTGEWKNGFRHGYGTNNYAPTKTLKSYQGYWKDDKKHGQGTLIHRNGDKYVGTFENDEYGGEGTLYYADGTSQSGYWENGNYVGKSNNNYGCISGNCENGYGTYTFENGSKYVGSWSNSKYHGQGTFFFSNGDKYIGNFVYDDFSGQGTYVFASDGRKYIGEWKNSKYNGYGTMYYSNGDVKSGIWEDGKYLGKKNNTGTAPNISWITPTDYVLSTSNPEFKIKLCIESETELKNTHIYINGIKQSNIAERGFKVVTASCDYTLEETVQLSSGDNKIKVVVENSAGTTTADSRTIKFSPAVTEKRLALVIGNSSYQNAPLRNPVNDAKAVATELKMLGFEVMLYTDIGQIDMKRHIRSFGEKLSTQKGVGLFYFAGHGIQLGGQNFLVPVDALIEKEQDVELESVNLRRLLGEMDYARNDLNIVILDACRNNPFARSFRSGGSNGLASTIAPQGTFIAYATAPGSVASDGSGQNGLYTEELIKALKTPGLRIEDVFKQVRVNVYNKSNKKQVPWENSSIFGDFYFNK